MATHDWLPRNIGTAWDRMGVPESVKSMLLLNGNPAYCSWWDDFLGDAIDARYNANGGTGTQAVGVTAAKNGTLTLTTQGNQATDSAVHTGPGLHWDGTNGFYMASRIKLDAITNCKFSVGLTDEQTDTGPINSKASATFNVSDCAVLSFDSADDTLLTFQSNGGSVDANTDTTFTVVADTYFIVEFVGRGTAVSAYVNGQYMAGGPTAIAEATDLMPIHYVEQNDTAARTMTVDWLFITGPRF